MAAAVLLDLALGDPRWLPHPVRLMGRLIARGEAAARRLPLPPRWQGAVLAGGLVAAAWGAGALLPALAGAVHPDLRTGTEALLLFYCLALRSLAAEAGAVRKALEAGGLAEARRRLSRIVGRDTAELGPEDVARAAVESVAENTVDGFLSPLCYAALGGPALALAFKMASTLDSMVGYRDERYREFGTAAARLDDLANFLPARAAAWLAAAAAPLVGAARPEKVLRVVRMDAATSDSPNSGFPEAAFAAALGVRLSGPARYRGRLVERPYILPEGREPGPRDIRRAVRLMGLVAACAVALVLSPAAVAWLAAEVFPS
nr:adenosylcobinamide-phosphate synthase CbiB [Dissulfurirhabdus thermomarina]